MQERLFRGLGRIHISKTPNGLVVSDFVDHGNGATFLHIQYTFARCTGITFMGDKKKVGQTYGEAARAVVEKWIGSFGAPGVI